MPVAARKCPRQAEVRHADASVEAQQQVTRLEVAVDYGKADGMTHQITVTRPGPDDTPEKFAAEQKLGDERLLQNEYK